MQSTLRISTRVLSGGKIEVDAPGLAEGQAVQVIVLVPDTADLLKKSAFDLIESFPPGPRSAPTWEEFEREFQEERNSWDH